MKRVVFIVLTILLVCIFSMMGIAEEEKDEKEIHQSGEYSYYINEDGSVTLCDCDDKKREPEIPVEIGSRKVTGIGDGAFCGCYQLSSIEIPDSIVSIGDNPFVRCDMLSQIIVSADNENYAVIDNVLFDKKEKILVCYPCELKDTEYIIPEGIRAIGKDAFYQCEYLENIEIPDTVTTIGDGAFMFCRKWKNIEIPNSVTTIGKEAFRFCNRFEDIEIPDSITIIEDEAFSDCVMATSIEIPDSVTEIRDNAFSGCIRVTSVEIPSSVVSIGSNPFKECNSLTQIQVSKDNKNYVVIDESLLSKDEKTLISYPCGLSNTEYVVPENTQKIGDWAFAFCEKLESIEIPDSVTEIGDDAFNYCDGLKSIKIPGSVTEIGDRAFNEDTSLIVEKDSYAAQYAEENKIPYTYLDSNDWLNE